MARTLTTHSLYLLSGARYLSESGIGPRLDVSMRIMLWFIIGFLPDGALEPPLSTGFSAGLSPFTSVGLTSVAFISLARGACAGCCSSTAAVLTRPSAFTSAGFAVGAILAAKLNWARFGRVAGATTREKLLKALPP